MYSDNQRHSSARRANDEFLRRMLGGEMSSCGGADHKPQRVEASREDAEMGFRKRPCSCMRAQNERGERGSSCPIVAERTAPACNDGDNAGAYIQARGSAHSTSLAMVYSPVQRFEHIYEPEKALSRGTLFEALDLPFVGCGRKEACARRCDR